MKPRKLVLAQKAAGPTQKQIERLAVNLLRLVNRIDYGGAGGAASGLDRVHLPG